MLKTLLLAGTMIVAAPALAQTTGGTGTTGTMQGGQAGTGTMTAPADTTGTMATPTDTTTSTTAPTDSTMSSSSTKPSKSSKSRRSPTSSSPTSQSSAAAPTDTTTTTPSTTAADPSQPQTADAGGAAAQPAAGGVGSVVEQEFATYDKDSDGQLSKVEFSAWMDALKTKQPAGSAAATDPTYNAKAFAQADTDKSAALSKGELTSFLSGGKASS